MNTSPEWPNGPSTPMTDEDARLIDAWFRAANYLSVGQIYLLDNPLLRDEFTKDDVKPRLLGHWGTTPGLNFLYAHFNRAIKQRGLNGITVDSVSGAIRSVTARRSPKRERSSSR